MIPKFQAIVIVVLQNHPMPQEKKVVVLNKIVTDIQGIADYYLIEKPLFKITQAALPKTSFEKDSVPRNPEWNNEDEALAKDWQNYFEAKEDFFAKTTSSLSPAMAKTLKGFEDFKTLMATILRPHMNAGFHRFLDSQDEQTATTAITSDLRL